MEIMGVKGMSFRVLEKSWKFVSEKGYRPWGGF